MSDRRLDDELRRLAPHRPSPGFSRRVLARLDEPGPKVPRWRIAVAAALVAIVAGFGSNLWVRHREAAREARWQRWEAETRALERELETLRADAEASRLLWVGGDESVDYVVDLDQVGRLPAAAPGDRRGGTRVVRRGDDGP